MSTKSAHAARAKRDAEEERLDRVFGALSDRTRRALLARLASSPANITELAQPFDMSLPAVSKHIRVLQRAGLVRRAIDGRVHRCSLDTAPLEDADEWLARHRALWTETLDSLAAFVAETPHEE